MSGANQSISAGLGGFLAFFLLAIALWLLMRNMNARLRNVRFAEEAEEARLAEEAGEDFVSRPRGRQIFLPVREDPAPVVDPSAQDHGHAAPTDGQGAHAAPTVASVPPEAGSERS